MVSYIDRMKQTSFTKFLFCLKSFFIVAIHLNTNHFLITIILQCQWHPHERTTIFLYFFKMTLELSSK